MKKITLFLFLIVFSFGKAQSLEGTWKMSPQAGAFAVGPNQGDGSYYANDLAAVTGRACFFDDEYVFNADGTFTNVLGSDSWIEGWQGGTDACGTPVAPHNGSNPATYTSTANSITLTGVGAYLGLAKAYNGGELSNPANAPSSITYIVTSLTSNLMTLDIQVGVGLWWRFILAKQVVESPLEGTWKMSPQAGAFAVGPNQGDGSYYANDLAAVTGRACFFDDEYVFNADGTFTNVLGSQSWIEGWQGGTEACGTPVAPHNGSNPATYTSTANSITLSGVGAYLGLAKAYNGGELSNPANAPASITYIVTSLTSNLMTLDIQVGVGLWWRFILAKQGVVPTCNDGIQNGDETGIDCGGSCPNACPTIIDLPVTFEGTTIDYTVIDFGGNASTRVVDPTDSSNMVIQTIKTTGAQLWAGTTIGLSLANPIPLTATDSKMNVRVWSPDAGIPVRLKVEDPTDPTHSCETQINTTVAAGWQTMEFDFANEAPGTAALNPAYTFQRVSIFFNFGTDGATAGEKTYYFDDVNFGPSLAVENFSSTDVAIYPNPTSNILTIDSIKTIDSITVFNLLGQEVMKLSPSNTSSTFSIASLESGVYVVKIISEGISSTKRVIKN